MHTYGENTSDEALAIIKTTWEASAAMCANACKAVGEPYADSIIKLTSDLCVTACASVGQEARLVGCV